MKRILVAHHGGEPVRRALERQGCASEHLATNSKATVVIAR